MSTAREATSEDYAKFLKNEVETFQRNAQAIIEKRVKFESAFEKLSDLIENIFHVNNIGCIIDMANEKQSYSIITDEYFSKNKPIECSLKTLTFEKEYVSLKLAPEGDINSRHCKPDEVMIRFVLKHKLSHKSIYDQEKPSLTPSKDYEWAINEQYTLLYSEQDGWSLNIVQFDNNKPRGIKKNFTELLDENNVLRILHSVFTPVIRESRN